MGGKREGKYRGESIADFNANLAAPPPISYILNYKTVNARNCLLLLLCRETFRTLVPQPGIEPGANGSGSTES